MEFDNDRPVKHRDKIEITFWVLLALLSPLINCVSFFLNEVSIWWVIFLINLFILPAYIFYSGVLLPKYLFEKKYLRLGLLCIIFIAVIQLLLFGLYTIILNADISENAKKYFTYNYPTISREILWCIINLLIVTGITFIRKSLEEKDKVFNLEKDNNNFRLKYLRNQLNPHFLFNTLNSIYALSLQKSDNAPGMIIKLSDLMRYLLYECNEDRVPLNKEIEFISNYIDIEKLRYNADIRFTVEGETDNIMIEPFLFIAFVENGFKHAFNNSFSNTFIYIAIKISAEQIELTVVNNSNEDLEMQAKKIHSTGIKNSKTILDLLYPSTHALNIIQTEKEEHRASELRLKNAKNRLQSLYPDSHTLDVILNNSAFTVSLIIKNNHWYAA